MISRAQQILIKRAQREAGLEDFEYREALALVSGCRSTTDPKMTDRGVDLALAYMEAIHWRKVDAGELQPSCNVAAIFRQRGYWAAKNPGNETSRDRYAKAHPSSEVADLENGLEQLGFSSAYRSAIRSRVTGSLTGPAAEYAYKAALKRTLTAKRRKLATAGSASTGTVDAPF
jgi:hypothetical protein